MRVCLMIEGQQGVTWPDWCALADACDELGFEGLFRSDHYFSARGVSGRGATDAWTLIGALAARTSRIRLGTLVSPVTFRPPAVLAKAATTVDEISGGRLEVGMGAGWWEEEHTQFGFPFYDVHERWARLDEAAPIVHGLCTKERFSFDGTYYRLDAAEFLPKPVQRPHPPLILGGKAVGPRMQRLIGRYADEFNTVGGLPEEAAGRFARARSGFEAEGRDPSTLVTSLMTWFFVGRTEDEYLEKLRRAPARLREYAEAGVQRIFLNHELYDDLEMLEVVANEVLPRIDL